MNLCRARRLEAVGAVMLVALGMMPGGPAKAGPPSLLVPGGVRADSLPFSEPAPFIFPGQAPPDTSDRERAAKALEYFQIGVTMEGTQPGTAAIAYQNALRLNPLYPEANYRLGLLLAGAGEYAKAAQFFGAELVRDSTHTHAARELGLALSRAGDAPHAIGRLERLTHEHPRDDEAWRALGFAYKQAGRPSDAEAAYRKAIRLTPRRGGEHRDLAVLLSSIGHDDEARKEFRRATALDPDDATAWYNLGNLERRRARLEDALTAYRRAEGADSTLALAVQGQVTVLETMGRAYDAARTYDRWLVTHPDDHNARDYAIRLLVKAGRPDLAIALARDGVRQNPKSVEARVLLGQTLAEHGSAEEALAELENAEKLAADDAARQQVHALVEALRTRTQAATPRSPK